MAQHAFVGILLLLSACAAQRGSKYRCRDKDPMCVEWKARGECTNNYAFMAESCASACGICENAGLAPTPAVFQLDFVCKDTLALAPATLTTPYDEAIPDGCAFPCRDNMTDAICKGAATDGLCDTQAATMRFQCPESCGVCKALELPATTTTATYPKHACRHEDGDKYDYKERCSDWAANGEVLRTR